MGRRTQVVDKELELKVRERESNKIGGGRVDSDRNKQRAEAFEEEVRQSDIARQEKIKTDREKFTPWDLLPGSSAKKKASNKIQDFLESRPKVVNNFINSRGHLKMKSFNICRMPIQSAIKTVSNIATAGKIGKKQKELNYDDVYHLFLIITFENGEQFSIEKNETVIITKSPSTRGGSCKRANITSQLTFQEMMERLEERYARELYRYDFAIHNCQDFLIKLTREMGVKGFDNWIRQDFSSVISKDLRKAGAAVTDLASIWSRLFGKSITF